MLLQILFRMATQYKNLFDIQADNFNIHSSNTAHSKQINNQNQSALLSMSSSIPKVISYDYLGVEHSKIIIMPKDEEIQMTELPEMHQEVKIFLKNNFGFTGLQLIPVQLFTNYLIREFHKMFDSGFCQGNILSNLNNRINLLQYLKIRMGGNLIDLQKLAEITKNDGLFGLLSGFLGTDQRQYPSLMSIKIEIEKFAFKLVSSLQKQFQLKLNEQMNRIQQKYSETVHIFQKIKGLKGNRDQNRIDLLNKKIKQLQHQVKRSQAEVQHIKKLNIQLIQENIIIYEELQKESQRSQKLTLDKTISKSSSHLLRIQKPLQNNNLCTTPKIQKSSIKPVPGVLKNRSKSLNDVLIPMFMQTPLKQTDNSEQIDTKKKPHIKQILKSGTSKEKNKSQTKECTPIIQAKYKQKVQDNKKSWKR